MPYDTRAPKEQLHHLPAPVLRRPSVSADPTQMLSGMLGSRLLDRRPPHYRCPAVPGLKTSTRAILMALSSSVLPSMINCLPNGELRTAGTSRTAGTAPLRTAGDANCSAAYDSATLRQPAPSPVLHLLRLGTPLPNLPARASAADAFTEVLPTPLLVPRTAPAGTATASTAVLTAAPDHCSHPVRPSVPSPSCNHPGSGTPPPHRTTNHNCLLPTGSSCLPGPAVSLRYEGNHNHTTTQCLLQQKQISARSPPKKSTPNSDEERRHTEPTGDMRRESPQRSNGRPARHGTAADRPSGRAELSRADPHGGLKPRQTAG
ncbi:hypothetical protein QFZ76_009379 [Streptomyces sp. V4I2]|nr:hypothetical protein [Streptomyces sp. V4I2]